ncbi:MAG: glycoside hydrolase family 2 TIM barrel-domain containing protein [Mangrovibacterium sp.]
MTLLRTFMLAALTGLSMTLPAQPTQIVYLSGTDAANTVEWDFFCTDGQNSGQWTKIPVPSNWELQGFGTYNYGHDWKNKEIKLGDEHGLYRHSFDVPASWKGKTVNIVFDGSMTDTQVQINGKVAGPVHQGAFYRFRYDISKLLKYGQRNLLEADVAKRSANESVNKAEREADFWIFGGIFRPVFLEVLPAVHMKRVAIDARADGSFSSLVVLSDAKSDYTLLAELTDLKGNPLGNAVQTEIRKGKSEAAVSGNFPGVKPWNPEWPNLYQMKFSLKKGDKVLHEVTERVGFRTVELRPHDGIYVNGEKVVFKGVCRHSFWPETGRCLSEENHLTDIRLMKEMNMNAVRMSHYVPDKQFLELCDSLGLFVLDEVTGWQDGYDTIVGPKLVKETVLRDENHPCVVVWDHGNEGGWTFANEKGFHETDIQKRPVIYPWLLRNGVDTHHYPDYDYAVGRYVFGNDPFMPTEFMHGLYDGGHGAGLDDYWRNYQSSPLHAGGFLWVLADEAVLRTDKPGQVFDADGNHAPDGILGPHREKEGSFYTIREIWSPVQIRPVTVNRQWDGKLFLDNKFLYTNLKDCSFGWKAFSTGTDGKKKPVGSGTVAAPDALPGETSMIRLDAGQALQRADIFEFTATDHHGQELYTWSWPVVQPDQKATEFLQSVPAGTGIIKVEEDGNKLTASVQDLTITFGLHSGLLLSVKNAGGTISLSGGPVPVGMESEVTGTKWEQDNEGNFVFTVNRSAYPEKVTWKLLRNGLMMLEASPFRGGAKEIDYIGISFNYPEEKCRAVSWMGSGPYRVWKNRLKGANFGVWEKAWNNTITGESFNELIYPEFKGYHGKLYRATLETDEQPFTILSETPNLYFRLFTPAKPAHAAGGTYPPFPAGDLSFLYEIPPIGNKFRQAAQMGPKSQKGQYAGHSGDTGYPIRLWFDFRRNL